MAKLAVTLNRLSLQNPILVASGTFGYAKEMAAFVDFPRLGGIIPKTVTPQPRIGNAPPRTVEVTSGMLNSIGLDNDGIDTFIEKHVPYLTSLGTAAIANIAGRTIEDFATMAAQLEGTGVAGVELNISCPNVSGGVDFGTNPKSTEQVITAVRSACSLPVIAKLTPNVTKITEIAAAAEQGGADAVSMVNTFQGIAINWRTRRPILGNTLGGLSGPAIKPLALRCVFQVAQSCSVPIIGIGGIANIDDVMEFLVAGASAVQIGTANFYNPGLSSQLVQQLSDTLDEENCDDVNNIIGSIETNPPSGN